MQTLCRRIKQIISHSPNFHSIIRNYSRLNNLQQYLLNFRTNFPYSPNFNAHKHWKPYMYCVSEGVSRGFGVRYLSSASFGVKDENGVVRFAFGDLPSCNGGKRASSGKDEGRMIMVKKKKKSRKAKLNELRFYRLKARKRMKSSNPEVRIRYKLEKISLAWLHSSFASIISEGAKRKEAWLIEKLRKYELPKAPIETYDPEILTEEEKFYLKRTGEKKKNYVPVGRRGVFGGVVLNMHLHWKRHETVKVVCKPCRPGQVHVIAEELSRLSKGVVIDIKPDNTIIFYRGKNYVRPEIMSPPDTLSKSKALEKYKYEQSLEHTSQFIEKLEKDLEEYHEHLARFRRAKDIASKSSNAVD